MAESAPRRVFLVDGSGLVYRAYFALIRNPLVNTKGENVSAIHGFLTTLLKTLREESPDAIAVAFDSKGPTFRHERFKEYKANRPPTPPDLRHQLQQSRELLDVMGVSRLEAAGVEADDIVGTLAARAREQGADVVIVSADKDFTQLIGEGIRQWVPPRAPQDAYWLDDAAVLEKWGVRPDQMVDLLALMGDSSDNIPGVAGVGQKTAAKLIGEHGSLDAVYENLDRVPQKGLRAKLEAGREDAFLSRELVRIRTDLDVAARFEDMSVPQLAERPEFAERLRELEFRRILESLGLDDTEAWVSAAERLSDVDALERTLERWTASGRPLALAAPVENPGPRSGPPAGLAFAWEPGQAYYFALVRDAAPAETERIRALLAGVLASEAGLVAHDAKSILHALRHAGVAIGELDPGAIRDTMLASYLIDSEGDHDLAAVSAEHLRHRPTSAGELQGKGRSRTPLFDLDPVDLSPVAAEQADVTLRLVERLEPVLRRHELVSLWEELECPLVTVLYRMEERGIRLDVPFLRVLSKEMSRGLERLTREIYAAAGTEFNIASPGQLGDVLFETLGLPKKKRTKTGYSTDQQVLEGIAELHPVPRLVLEHRSLSKLKGTYIDALPELVDPGTGRIHANFRQAVAATGRLSATDPNIQNIPIRTETGREIRKAFIAEPGCLLVSADYSQIELRVLAHLSEDPGLAEAFRTGEDVHAATAARLFGVAPDQVDVSLRAKAKTVNFGVVYGMGPQRLSRELGLSMAEARAFIADYFAKMPGVKAYMENNLASAREHGYVRTLFGRRRVLRGLNSGDQRVRAQAERVAGNTPIQGSAADLIKAAMLRADERIRAAGMRARLILQIHDELVVEAPEEEVEDLVPLLRASMEEAAELRVPLQVEVGRGRTWEEAHS